jgi:uncharacterized protein (DUF302 family)
METDAYTFGLRLDVEPAEAESRVRDALSAEGFGILTEIDVQATLAEKIGVEMPAYKILGACSPPLADKAIRTDPMIGALLPCNVVVRAHPDGGSEVFAADPDRMMEMSPKSDALAEVAHDARGRLERAFEALRG